MQVKLAAGAKERLYKCPECPKVCKTKFLVTQHATKHHSITLTVDEVDEVNELGEIITRQKTLPHSSDATLSFEVRYKSNAVIHCLNVHNVMITRSEVRIKMLFFVWFSLTLTVFCYFGIMTSLPLNLINTFKYFLFFSP